MMETIERGSRLQIDKNISNESIITVGRSHMDDPTASNRSDQMQHLLGSIFQIYLSVFVISGAALAIDDVKTRANGHTRTRLFPSELFHLVILSSGTLVLLLIFIGIYVLSRSRFWQDYTFRPMALDVFGVGNLQRAGLIILTCGSVILYIVRLLEPLDNKKILENCPTYYSRSPIKVAIYTVTVVNYILQTAFLFKFHMIRFIYKKTLFQYLLLHMTMVNAIDWIMTIPREMETMTTAYNKKNNNGVSSENVCPILFDEPTVGQQLHPFLFPWLLQYNIHCGLLFIIIYRHTCSDRDVRPITSLLSSQFTVGESVCHKAHAGVFIGLVIGLTYLGVVISVFSVVPENREFMLNVRRIFEAALFAFEVFLLSVISYKIRHFSYSSTKLSAVNRIPLMSIMLTFGFVILNGVFSLFPIFEAVLSDTHWKLAVYGVHHCVHIIHTLIQTPFLLNAVVLSISNNQQQVDKPGRNLISISILINLTVWISFSFSFKDIAYDPVNRNYYCPLVWIFITIIIWPIVSFYRLQCAATFLIIWRKAYEKKQRIKSNYTVSAIEMDIYRMYTDI